MFSVLCAPNRFRVPTTYSCTYEHTREKSRTRAPSAVGVSRMLRHFVVIAALTAGSGRTPVHSAEILSLRNVVL